MCGARMNHHADKMTEPRNDDERDAADAALGGVVQQVHTCPACTHIEVCPAPPPRVDRA
jgi:hypothetical protein